MIHKQFYDGRIHLHLDGMVVEGELCVPRNAMGMVIFVEVDVAIRSSSQYIATFLQKAGIGTLVMDLVPVDTYEAIEQRAEIDILSHRIVKIIEWLWSNEETDGIPIGLFGDGLGAAAALQTAARLKEEVKAVVLRGGREDLVKSELHMVTAPTLLIVGGNDREIVKLNREALNHLCCQKRLEIIAGATHLCDEKGALEMVAGLATSWYRSHFATVGVAVPA